MSKWDVDFIRGGTVIRTVSIDAATEQDACKQAMAIYGEGHLIDGAIAKVEAPE